MRQKYDEQDVVVLGLNSGNDSAEDLEAFVNAFQVTFPILLDANTIIGQYRQSGSATPYPLDYVIDQQGQVAYFSTEYDAEAMVVVVDDLLNPTSAAPDIQPAGTLLLQAAPNPFNPQTEIHFFLERNQPVSLNILDARGHLVRNLLRSEPRPKGSGKARWDGRDNQGRDLPSGLYMAQIKTLNRTAVTKLTLVR